MTLRFGCFPSLTHSSVAKVCDASGKFVGIAPFIRPTVHGDREDDANMATLGLFRGEQKRRLEGVAAGKVYREVARRRANAASFAGFQSAQNAQSQNATDERNARMVAMADNYKGEGDDE